MRNNRRALRLLLLLACFTLSSWAVLLAFYGAMNATGVEYPDIGLDVMRNIAMRKSLNKLARRPPGRRVERVAFLGDSTVVSYEPSSRTVPSRLQKAVVRLGRAEPPISVRSLAVPGMGPYEWYFLADEIADAGPDQVVMPVGLGSFSQITIDRLSRVELAGWIWPRRLPEAMALPIYLSGLTWDRLLLYVGIVRSGGFEIWRRLKKEQARVGSAQRSLAEWIGTVDGVSAEGTFSRVRGWHDIGRFVMQGGDRYNERGVRRYYTAAMDGVEEDHPVIRMLAATIRTFRRADIHVIVYVTPTNVEHIESLGLLDRDGLDRTLAVIERAVRESGGEFADLHDLFPDEVFSDPPGHFVYEGEIDGPALLARALAPRVVARARRAAGGGN
jgi:hypothetical protein